MTPFQQFHDLARDQVRVVVAAEIAVDAARAERFADLLRRCLVEPRVVGCQPGFPRQDPSPAALHELWLVLEEPPARGDRYFMVYDYDRGSFGLGVWEGPWAWLLDGWGGFFEMLERL